MGIRIANLSVDAGNFKLPGINLEINEKEYFIILGPTGVGKTVLIESIAGLRRIKGGEIWLGETGITGLEPEKRGVSIVYQDQVLFPHLSVKENIVFGLKVRKVRPSDIKLSLDWITGVLGIADLAHRMPQSLSGGERQKVALARALIVRPKLLLLDEPLSALDPETRETMQQELHRLQRSLGITVIHVTHDFEEAVTLADRIAIMNAGRIEQVGSPEEIFSRPNSEFVARFTMGRNIFPGTAFTFNDGRPGFRTGSLEFKVANYPDDSRHALVRPEDIVISPEGSKSDNCLKGRIAGLINKGAIAYFTVDVPPVFYCLVTRQTTGQNQFMVGTPVYLSFKPEAVHVF